MCAMLQDVYCTCRLSYDVNHLPALANVRLYGHMGFLLTETESKVAVFYAKYGLLSSLALVLSKDTRGRRCLGLGWGDCHIVIGFLVRVLGLVLYILGALGGIG